MVGSEGRITLSKIAAYSLIFAGYFLFTCALMFLVFGILIPLWAQTIVGVIAALLMITLGYARK